MEVNIHKEVEMHPACHDFVRHMIYIGLSMRCHKCIDCRFLIRLVLCLITTRSTVPAISNLAFLSYAYRIVSYCVSYIVPSGILS